MLDCLDSPQRPSKHHARAHGTRHARLRFARGRSGSSRRPHASLWHTNFAACSPHSCSCEMRHGVCSAFALAAAAPTYATRLGWRARRRDATADAHYSAVMHRTACRHSHLVRLAPICSVAHLLTPAPSRLRSIAP